MKATHTPSGKWAVRVPLPTGPDGKRKWKNFTRPTKKEALMAAEAFALQLRKDQEAGITELGTVADLCTRYVDLKSPVLSPSTVRGYRTALNRIRGTRLGGMELSRVTNAAVQAWVGELATEVSPKTVRNLYALFSAAAALFAPDKHFTVRLPQKIRPRLHTPSSAEVVQLLDLIRSEGDDVLLRAIMLSACCGMRRGEICALDADDIDRERGLITITRDMVRSEKGFVIKDNPKTDASNRTVPVPAEVLAILPEEGPIIGIAPSRISDRFHRACMRAGLTFRFHDLRSYWVTILKYAGIDDRTLQDLGGWNTDAVMKRVYVRSIEEERQKRLAQVSGTISSELNL